MLYFEWFNFSSILQQKGINFQFPIAIYRILRDFDDSSNTHSMHNNTVQMYYKTILKAIIKNSSKIQWNKVASIVIQIMCEEYIKH